MPNLVQPNVEPEAISSELPKRFPGLSGGLQVLEGGGTGNRSFVLRSPAGEWFLRVRNPKYADPAAMEFELDLLRHLKECGLPVHPPVISRQGKPWAELGAFRVQLFERVQGDQFEQRNRDQIREAARVLRLWHAHARRFLGDTRKQWEREDSFMIVQAGYDLAKQRVETQEQAEELAAAIGVMHELLRRLPPDVFWSLPRTIVHADYHHANMLFDGPRMVGLFDFDYACEHPRLKDVANMLMFFAAVRERDLDPADIRTYIQSFRFDAELVGLVLGEYEKDDPLTAAERKAMAPMMIGRWLQMRSCGIIKLPPEDRTNVFCSGMAEAIREIEEFRFP